MKLIKKLEFIVIFSAIVSSTFLMPLANAGSTLLMELEAVVYDNRFYTFIDMNDQVEVLADELEWAEGPVWAESLNTLLFSDVATDKVYSWDEPKGLKLFVQPSGHEPDKAGTAWRGSNGLAIDNDGALLLAQQSSRRLSLMSTSLGNPTSKYEVLASKYGGKSLNSPNDLVVHRSGDIYFTDPPYGLDGRENSSAIELDFFGVFRLTKNNELSVINRDLDKPNGIALSTDQSTLYVSNSEVGKEHIIAIELDSQGKSKNSRLFFDATKLSSDGPGSTDGMAVHSTDYLFVSIPNGLGILSPEGKLLGKLALGQVTNMTFDNKYSTLYITTPKRLLRLKIKGFN
ncbi:MAG: SMP-30/gluconolactonase/LRE family protein [Cocleimonas sp.]